MGLNRFHKEMNKETKTSSSLAVLTIAGSDSSGGAGIQADLKTFAAFGVYGMSVVTAVTAQNSCGVQGSWAIPPENVISQLKCVVDDIPVKALKTGMLVDEDTVCAVAEALEEYSPQNLVVDPVITAKDGTYLLSLEAIGSLSKFLLPLARLVTPNTYEAAVLAGMDAVRTLDGMKEAAMRIVDSGAAAVLVKGGHLEGVRLFDVLYDGGSWQVFTGERIGTREPHGTGCTLSAAITASLAKGDTLQVAVETARDYTRSAIANAQHMGKGYSLLDHNRVEGEWNK
jgi:hydroxymethylpyrimidine/phosphomethylpyrimidine kinase